jgi:hypothetical protein
MRPRYNLGQTVQGAIACMYRAVCIIACGPMKHNPMASRIRIWMEVLLGQAETQ